MPERIYLDNAATSWPKPESVYAAVEASMRHNGASAGRSTFADASQAKQTIESCRRGIATLLNCGDARNVVFTNSGTDSLSTAILGLLQAGDHVVTTEAEHNSVLRPLMHLKDSIGVRVSVVECDATGLVDIGRLVDSLEPETRLLAMTGASNVTGVVQPIADAFAAAKETASRVVTLLDTAQTLGHLPIDVNSIQCDLLAAPGHKGLFGPLGTGVLCISESIAESIRPLRFGGTGISSSDLRHPKSMPEKFEAGNVNVPAIAGLNAGLEFIASEEGAKTKQNLMSRSEQLFERLQAIDAIQLHGPDKPDHRIGIFSLTVPGFDPHEVAVSLDAMAAVQVRSGLHCAPLIHKRMGTAVLGGTVRLSVGGFTSESQIDVACDAIEAIATGI